MVAEDSPMHVLVSHGSARGGTAGIAEIVAEGLRAAGHTADVVPARQVRDVGRYAAVIVGGALQAQRWHPDARRLVKRHAQDLRTRPVWFFSSGPLDDSASRTEIAPTKQVARLYAHVHARGHTTFGGYLAPDARGFVASKMARTRAGDWRDPPRIRAWATQIGETLATLPAAATAPVIANAWPFWPAERAVRRSLVALCAFTGLTASAGGIALALRPDGALLRAPMSLLQHTPFVDFLVPGLLLSVVGLANLAAASALVSTPRPIAEALSFFSGAAVTGFVAVEMIMFRSVNWLQLLFFVIGLITMVQSLKLRRRRAPVSRLSAWADA
jgi:menaquinone-dependent protoporphyrinogen oxidase